VMLSQIFFEPLSDPSVRHSMAAVLALALSAGPIGVFLMLRRMSLVGDAMSHAILPGVALGFLAFGLNVFAMTFGGLVAGVVIALLAGAVSRATALQEDASLAVFLLMSLALAAPTFLIFRVTEPGSGAQTTIPRRSNTDVAHDIPSSCDSN